MEERIVKLTNGEETCEFEVLCCDDGQWVMHDVRDVDHLDGDELTDGSDASVLEAFPYLGDWKIIGSSPLPPPGPLIPDP